MSWKSWIAWMEGGKGAPPLTPLDKEMTTFILIAFEVCVLVLRTCDRERTAARGCASREDGIKSAAAQAERTAPGRRSGSDNNDGIEWYLDMLASTTTELEEREESQSLDGACIPKPYVKQSRVAKLLPV